MKKVLFTALMTIAVLAVSCNKDQSSVNKLEGVWKASEVYLEEPGGSNIDLLGTNNGFTMQFNKCKMKRDEWCSGMTILSTSGTATDWDNFVYQITGDGKVINMKDHENASETWTINIIELTKSKAHLEETEAGDPEEIVYKLEKQD